MGKDLYLIFMDPFFPQKKNHLIFIDLDKEYDKIQRILEKKGVPPQ